MPLDLNNLDGPQRRIVRDAFLDAFDASSFDMLLQDTLNKKPLTTLVASGPLEMMVFHLINLSRKEGWTSRLIAAAEQTSANPRILALRDTLKMSQIIDLSSVDNQVRACAAGTGGLERMVREDGGFPDWGLWVGRMSEIQRQICRIEYPVGLKMGGGTGFLVAPDFVLTNYHVIEKHAKGILGFENLTCRFDFAIGSSSNTTVKLAQDWLVDCSMNSPYDPGDRGGLPDVDHLDYALLRLDRAVGDELVNGIKRGWIPMSSNSDVPAAGAILFIGQHPGLEPLKLGVGASLGSNENRTRVRYDANTERGSSGSPCFNLSLNAVALHHGGDPDYSHLLGEYNQGIPTDSILKRMASRGVTKFWI